MNGNEKKRGRCSARCVVNKCSCGAFHLHYRYAVVIIGKQTLFQIMEDCYRWEELNVGMSEGWCTKPFVVMLGIVTITVPQVDFEEFSKAIQDAVSLELDLPGIAGGLLSFPGSSASK
ncbi:hypothetical protein [Chlorobium phaeobacteroides]|uniref:Uncharacterized protein n=1 Tax=Chlorobium phaeobacteroides (strain DSM 266 / SMG 266 / 2430) TaxID=290317 RepID=A1BDA8_CHLPD|nr:hypothetical protein [Chlorobium phaeobacteroides]ABL64385.1 conserved hypothetical protein [Chlorobium phaeobacteroides DSM 266]